MGKCAFIGIVVSGIFNALNIFWMEWLLAALHFMAPL
jgi:hypothetical protein